MPKQASDRWKRQWFVPSNSGGKDHKVSEDFVGAMFCDCWPFRKDRTCKHIDTVRLGGGTLIGDEPTTLEPLLQFWNVSQVTPKLSDGTIEFLKVPLMPFGDKHAHFAYTILYDLLFYEVKWSTIRKQYSVVAERLTEAEVRKAVRDHGRCVRGPWRENADGEGGDWGPYVVTHREPAKILALPMSNIYNIQSEDGTESLRCPGCNWKASDLFVVANSADAAAESEEALCSDCFAGEVRDDYPVVIRRQSASPELVRLPDGYNGDAVLCHAEPVESDGVTAKLMVAEPGMEYMHKYVSVKDLDAARKTG